MKIAYFTDTFLPQVNGVATYLANQTSKLGEEGHQVLVFIPKLDGIPRQKFKAKNVTIIHLPSVPALVYTEGKLGIFGLPQIIRHLTKFKPDIIHLQSPFTVGLDAVMAAKLFKIPLVGTVHLYFTNSDYLRFVKYKMAVKLLDRIAIRYLNFLYNQCDLILAPSKKLVNELKSNGFKKVIHYLPNGIVPNSAKFLSAQEKEKVKKKYHLKEKVILHFGRLSYEKNIDQLIRAYSLLSKKHKDVSLLLIGDGPANKSLRKLVKKLKIEREVIFTGFIEHQILISSGILSVGNVFATASNMEVNPMAVLEAMLYGLPIVGIRQAGIIELVSENGYLVEPENIRQLAEKIEKILYDQSVSKKMGEKSLELIKPYSIDKTTHKLLGLYEGLLSRAVRT